MTKKAFWGNLRTLPLSFSPQSPSLLPVFSQFHFLPKAHISLRATAEPHWSPPKSQIPFISFSSAASILLERILFLSKTLNNHTFRQRPQDISKKVSYTNPESIHNHVLSKNLKLHKDSIKSPANSYRPEDLFLKIYLNISVYKETLGRNTCGIPCK